VLILAGDNFNTAYVNNFLEESFLNLFGWILIYKKCFHYNYCVLNVLLNKNNSNFYRINVEIVIINKKEWSEILSKFFISY
jgi:hypothetical protein